MLSNMFSPIYMIQESLISQLLNVSLDMFVAHWIMVCNCMRHHLGVLLIDLVAQRIIDPHPCTTSFLVRISSLGPPSDKSTISWSIVEVEYRGVANVVVETNWLHNVLRGLHYPLISITLVYYDIVSAVYVSTNPIQYQRTKHLEIDIHFV